jgi:plasmid stability protein
MTLKIDLPDERQAALKAKAQAQGLSAEQFARQVLEHDLEDAPRQARASGTR